MGSKDPQQGVILRFKLYKDGRNVIQVEDGLYQPWEPGAHRSDSFPTKPY